jgi:predicted HAD superfamily Cof-like phosphohydrolase
MSVKEVDFIGKMILDEVMELFATVYAPADAKAALKGFIDSSKDIARIEAEDQAVLIAEQADALVDVYYYSLNAACKKGVNLSTVFDIVHGANMAKRDPATGQFLKREDGKIIKPAGWKAPDIKREIMRQLAEGAFVSGAAPRDADDVREFTSGTGQPTPATPELMSEAEVSFIGKMILDEVMELFATVYAPADAKAALKGFIDSSKDIARLDAADTTNLIAEQADALVDVYYYSLNAACKKGVNLSAIFGIVHAANMAKRDPATGQFLKREDGKVIKPVGWMAPDVEGEIRRQLASGAWTSSVSDVLSATSTPTK